MEFKQVYTYTDIEILEKQQNFISSKEKINNALKEENILGFDIYFNQQKIGFILLNNFCKNSFFLWNFIIDKKYQNMGYGTLALKKLFKFLKENYFAKLLTTTYNFNNYHAKHIYEKLGFEQTDIVNENEIHEVNMKKTL